MNFTQIKKFLDSGLTVDEIQQLIDAEKTPKGTNDGADAQPIVKQETKPTKDDVENGTGVNTDANTEPEWAKSLVKSMSELTKTMQANALSMSSINGANQPKTVDDMADEILANILNPKE